MKEGILKFFALLFYPFYFLAMPLLTALCYGVVLRVMWGWFAVPLFRLPELPLFQAAGAVTLILFLIGKPLFRFEPEGKKDEDHSITVRPLDVRTADDLRSVFGKMISLWVMSSVLTPAVVLFMGWIFHLFM